MPIAGQEEQVVIDRYWIWPKNGNSLFAKEK
jgi:hypothetical protein